MDIKLAIECPRCKDLAKFNDIRTIEISSEGIFLIREYICDCGNIFEIKEKFKFIY